MSELEAKLARRQQLQSGEIQQTPAGRGEKPFNPNIEFPEFSRKEVKEYETLFKKHNTSGSGSLDLMELKLMMEQLGIAGKPQTHISLKGMIKEVDEDNDGAISLREFFLIFRKAARGELNSAGLADLAHVNVEEVKVGGARDFFEAKSQQQTNQNRNEEEIRREQAEVRKQREEKAKKKAEFKSRMQAFNN